MKFKGAIFDLDGTLIDSMHIWDDLGCRYLELKGVLPNDGLSDALRALSLTQSAKYLKSEYSIPDEVSEIISDINGIISDFYENSVPLKPGMYDLLQQLKLDGVKMCIATASDEYLAKKALERTLQ